MKNLVLRSFLSCLLITMTTMSYAGNYLPILTWPGTGTYKSDGLDPEVGVQGTTFTFRVKYIDYDNEAPAGDVMMVLNIPNEVPMGLVMSPEGSNQDYRKGVIYRYATSTLTPLSYNYSFVIKIPGNPPDDPYDMIINTAERSGTNGATFNLQEADELSPIITHQGPKVVSDQILGWLGSKNYESDGLDPENGGTNTVFTYKVKCFGTPSNGYPKLVINSLNNDMVPIIMKSEAGGNSLSGTVYYATSTLQVDTIYTYRFQLTDVNETPPTESPRIYPTPTTSDSAFFDWTGGLGYENDGIDPDIASYGSTFTCKIKYVDITGIPPVNSPIIRIDGRDYPMDYASGTSMTGIIYQYQYPTTDLSSLGTISCSIRYVAESTYFQKDFDFWTANIPPLLTWTGEPGYKDDGVQPNVGTAGTVFTFRIKYTDPEGNSPCEIWLKGDKEIAMEPKGYNGIYECTGTFSLGQHYYWFSACEEVSGMTVIKVSAGGSKTVVNKSDLSLPIQLASFIVSIGSLTSVAITGTNAVGIDETATFTAQAFDELGEEIEDSYVTYSWYIIEGVGLLTNKNSKTVTFTAGTSTGTITLEVTAQPANADGVLQGDEVTATKTITIKPGKPTALFFLETGTNTLTANVPIKGSRCFSILGKDRYENPTLIGNCTWYVEGAIGTISSSSGNKATFTAGANTGTGAVVVSTMGNDGTLTATVSITITHGDFDHFDILVENPPISVDGSITITLYPKDVSGNTVDYSGTSSPILRIMVDTDSATLGSCVINSPIEFPWPPGLKDNLGTGTIYASINGINKGTSSPFPIVSGSPHHFNISSPVTNSAVQAGDASIPVTAQLQDRYNNPSALGTSACVVFQSDSFGTFTIDSTGITSPGTITVQTNASGQIVGSYQPNFSSGSKATLVSMFLAADDTVMGTSGAIILTIPAALATIDVVLPATFTAGVPATISVAVRDSYNNPATATLSFSSSLGTMTPNGCIITGSITNGFSWQTNGTWTGTTSFTKAQMQATLTITAQNGKTATTTFAVLPAEPHNLQATGTTTYNGSSGDEWTLGVRLKDMYGNPIEGRNIFWEFISNPSNAMLANTVSTTNQAGEAGVILTLGTKTGTCTIKVYPEGFSGISATFTATTIAGSPTISSGSYPSTATVDNKIVLEAVLMDNSGNPFQGRNITWQVLQPLHGAFISPSTSTTNSSGMATTSLTLGTKTGVYIVTARYGSLTATFTITAMPDNTATMTTTITPGTVAVVNSQMILGVELTDQWGNPAATTTVNWQPQGLAATTTQTINGSTTLEFILGTKTGVYLVTATSGALTATFTITALPDKLGVITTAITPGTVAVVSSQLVLMAGLYDQWGNPAATTTVNWQPQGMAATTTQTINGIATLAFTLGTKTGVSIITSTSGTLTATFSITAIAGTSALSQNFTHASRTVGNSITLEVCLKDEFGNPGSGTVSWSLVGSLTQAASLTAASTPIDQTGSASVVLTIGTKTGDYVVRAQVDGWTATWTITAEPGVVGTMLTGYVPSTAAVNTTLPLTIGLYDSYGNPVSATVDWPSTSTQTINGTATLMFTLGTRTGIYEITASHDGRIATFTITATPGTPTISQNLSHGYGTVGENVTLEVYLRDEFSNPCPGTITWNLIEPLPAAASLSATSTPIDLQTGSASVVLTIGTKTGDYVVRAQVDGYTATWTISALSGNLATDTVSGTSTGAAVVNGTMTFTLNIYDEYGNPIQSGNVDWTVIRGTITTATKTTSISNGLTEYSYKIDTIAGTYTISAKFGAMLFKPFNICVSPGSPTLTPSVSAISCLPGGNIILEVSSRDEFGNPCPGTVEWSLIEPSSATVSFSATSTTIDQTGLGTTTFTPGTMSGNYIVKAAIAGQEGQKRQEATWTITVRTMDSSKELLIYPNPLRVQEWNYSKYPDGPWVRFGSFNSHVTIRIYDISGNLIRIMENVQPAPDGFVKWDMKNEGSPSDKDGVEVNSGVYLCITICNGEKRIERFAVIR